MFFLVFRLEQCFLSLPCLFFFPSWCFFAACVVFPQDDPSPVNRVVQHFQLLFGVSSLGGCLPKLNELYRFSSETKTFLRTCGDLLKMPEASGSEAIMRRLETVLEGTVDADADARLCVSHDAESWAGQSIELAAEA